MIGTRAFAMLCGVSPETILAWRAAGKIKPAGRTPGGHYRWLPEQADELMRAGGMAERAKDILALVNDSREQLRILGRAL